MSQPTPRPPGSSPPGTRPSGQRLTLEQALQFAQQQAARDPAAGYRLLQEIVRQRPQQPEAQHRLALLALRLGRVGEAAAALRAAVELAPENATYLANLVEVLRRCGETAEAVERGRAALQRFPDHPLLLANLGSALLDRDEASEALALLRRASEVGPATSPLLSTLGNALLQRDEIEEAFRCYARAVEADPRNVDALANWGLALRDENRLAESRARFRAALAVDPNHGNARSMLAMLDLLEGEFQRGWPEYEWRWRSQGLRPRPLPMPPWRGEALAGRRLFVHSEQGHGDTLQFVRYLPLLQAAAPAEIVCEVAPQLVGLLTRSFPGVAFVARGTPLPEADVHLPLLSAPLRFDTRAETIPADVPYLQADPACVARWRDRLERDATPAQLRVGLVWGGSPTHRADRLRSIGLEALAPLRALSGVRFFGLQFGQRAPEAEAWGDDLVNLGEELGDFANTAGAVAALDLVVTVDTATAHLAGGLGQETWILLMKVPDWRWLLDRDDSPWYPTARLFRQDAPREWHGAVQRLADALRDRQAKLESEGRSA